jgi:hypothetical protein
VEYLDESGDETRPAGLMAGAETQTVIAVKIFVEGDVVPILSGMELACGEIVTFLIQS